MQDFWVDLMENFLEKFLELFLKNNKKNFLKVTQKKYLKKYLDNFLTEEFFLETHWKASEGIFWEISRWSYALEEFLNTEDTFVYMRAHQTNFKINGWGNSWKNLERKLYWYFGRKQWENLWNKQ